MCLKTSHADPEHLYWTLAQDKAVQRIGGFVMQGHILCHLFSPGVPR